ncbi:unnamed protein product [Psylliodes chrysocephalus]|uniref:Uncharacterized protein n=1 Tax=Psylliodes chrysocephalus TaxID=3402493 RepID=A0A9P0D4L3_9CUCU|nr:unnamed protein product [Psylliodes chrysocephala]
MLEFRKKLPDVNFVPIVSPLPELDDAAIRNLSTDQKYLYEMCHLISRGNRSLDLAARNPGQLSHARWLTKANRILHLYIGSKCPATNLRTIAEFVVKVYAPVRFDIKRKSSYCDGGRYVFRMIQLSRYLNNELKAVIDPVTKGNAYFYPGDILSFSYHTQAVERCVKFVPEAFNSVVGHHSRDEFICARIHSRTILPRFNTRAEYNS